MDQLTTTGFVLELEIGPRRRKVGPRPKRRVGIIAIQPLGGLNRLRGVTLREIQLRQQQERVIGPWARSVLDDNAIQIGGDRLSVRSNLRGREQCFRINRIRG